MKPVTRKYRDGETGMPFPTRIDLSTGQLGRMPGEILGRILGQAGALDALKYLPQKTGAQAKSQIKVLNSKVYQVIPAKRLIGFTSLTTIDKASVMLEEEKDLDIIGNLLDASIIFTDNTFQGDVSIKTILALVVAFIQKHVTLNNGEVNPALDLSILYSYGATHYAIPLGFAFGGDTMMICDWKGRIRDTLDPFANSMAGLGIKNCIYMSEGRFNARIVSDEFEKHGIQCTDYYGSKIIPTKYNEALIRYMATNNEFRTEEDRKFMLGSIGLRPHPTSYFLNVSPAVESEIRKIYSWAIESDDVKAIHDGGRWSNTILENCGESHAFSYVGVRVPRQKLEDAPLYMYSYSKITKAIERILDSVDEQNAMSLDDLVKAIAGSRDEGLAQFRTLMSSTLYRMAKSDFIDVVHDHRGFRYYTPS